MPSVLHLIVLTGLAIASVSARAEVIDIDNKTLARLIEEGVPVIDIRREDEWSATGVIDDSHLMTFFDAKGNHDAPAWRSALDADVAASFGQVRVVLGQLGLGLLLKTLSVLAGP